MTTSNSTRVKPLSARVETEFDLFMEKLFPLVLVAYGEIYSAGG
jgi:hypothetical protein